MGFFGAAGKFWKAGEKRADDLFDAAKKRGVTGESGSFSKELGKGKYRFNSLYALMGGGLTAGIEVGKHLGTLGVKSVFKRGASGVANRGLLGVYGGLAGGAYGYATSDKEDSTQRMQDAAKGAFLGGGALFFGTSILNATPELLMAGAKTAGVAGAAAGKGGRLMTWNAKKGAARYKQRVKDKSIIESDNIAKRTAQRQFGAIENSPLHRLSTIPRGVVTAPAKFALNNPALTIGGGAVAYAAGSEVMGSSPHESSLDEYGLAPAYDPSAIAAQELGSNFVAPMGNIQAVQSVKSAEYQRLMDSTQGLVSGLHRGRH